MPENKFVIAVIVNGQLTSVEANVHAPLDTIIPRALQQTGNTGQPPDNWELRDAQGSLLDTSKKISSFNFASDIQLFLNLKAGIGGGS